MCDNELYALSNAKNRSELLSALRNAKQFVFVLEEREDSFEIAGLLTTNEFKELFTALFRSAAPDDGFLVLINALHSCDQIYRLHHILILLDDLEKTCLESLLVDSIDKDPNDGDWSARQGELCRLLGRTTCLMHNIFGNSHFSSSDKTNDALMKAYLNNHWIYLFNSLKAALTNAAEKCRNAKNVNMEFLAGVTYELSRGDIDAFYTLVIWLGSQIHNMIWTHINVRLLTDTSIGIARSESLLILALLAAKDGEMLQACFDGIKLFGDEIHKNRIVRRIFFEKALFTKVFPSTDQVPEKLAVCLHLSNNESSGDGPWSTLHQDTICETLNIWANSIHVYHSTDEQLDYIDVALLSFVKYANEKIRRCVSTEVVTKMTAGVDIRLKFSDVRRRLRGMYIAEVFANWFSLGKLKFEYPSEANEFTGDLRKIVDDEYSVDMKAVKSDNEEKKVIQLEVQDTGNVTNEMDSDDDFPEYEIPEEELILKREENNEDYRSVAVPHYIRDCIEGLNEQQDYAKFEAALNALNPMIRRRAVGYEQSAEELICRLINLCDHFKTEHFQEKRQQLIQSCLVTSPHLGHVAIDIMFSRRCSMTNRYAILKALSDAASEYSSPTEVAGNLGTGTPEKDRKVLKDGEPFSKTKRFVKAPVMLRENRFTPIANSFFYPLTAIDQHREHLDLKGRDSELLSRILVCMAHLIKCSGSAPCTVKMSTTLAFILLPLRHNTNFAVREAILFCYASICLALSEEVLLQFYSEDLAGWLDYAAKLAEADPSADCREMAQMTVNTITSLIV
uniref:Telomere_reg-2 domain-containing protein n=1 Tax=Elaeophora elaphi TaxID=1147741 RepID=A0A158Q862_9BILA